MEGSWPDEEDRRLKDEDNPLVDAFLSPEVSHNAIIGHQSPQTMRFIGRINGVPFTVLIDLGSTHNFLSPTIAKRVGVAVLQNY